MDAGASRRIAQLAYEDAPAGIRLIEIGAGTGALTLALLEAGANVTALEIDRSSSASLAIAPTSRAPPSCWPMR